MGADEEPRRRAAVDVPKDEARRRAPCPTRTTRPSKSHAPIMFTTDLALKMDPAYGKISKRFHENPDEFAEARSPKAWYKLTHRDMGPGRPLPRPEWVAEPQRLAGPGPRGRSPADRREGHRGAEGSSILDVGPLGFGAGIDRLGVGVDVPRHRQAGRRQRRSRAISRRRRTGRSTSRPRSSPRRWQTLERDSAGVQRLASRAARRSRWRT